MKKWMLFGIFAVFASMSLPNEVKAMSNKDAFQRWRSLEISTVAFQVFLTSGCPCVIHDITVTSGTSVANPRFQYFGSSVTYPLTYGVADPPSANLNASTSPLFDVDTSGDRYDLDEVITSNSIFYSMISSSTIRVRWDYFLSPPTGLNQRGYKP